MNTLFQLSATLLLTLASALTPARATEGPCGPLPDPAPATSSAAPRAGSVALSIVCTSSGKALEGFTVAGGSWTRSVIVHHSAFLVRHGDEHLLIDTGLGQDVDAQYAQDMPPYLRPFMRYQRPAAPAARQLAQHGIQVKHIIVTHPHWDHLGGAGDFPGVPVWLSGVELETLERTRQGQKTYIWPSQARVAGVNWQTLSWSDRPHEGFERSIDWFGDGRVVVVPLPGHTPGAVGVFVTTDSGQRYLLVGDAVWRSSAIPDASPKFWAASRLVDDNADQTLRTLERIRDAKQRDPQLQVLPTHDGDQQLGLGLFPKWLN